MQEGVSIKLYFVNNLLVSSHCILHISGDHRLYSWLQVNNSFHSQTQVASLAYAAVDKHLELRRYLIELTLWWGQYGGASLLIVRGRSADELVPQNHIVTQSQGATPMPANSNDYPHDPHYPIGQNFQQNYQVTQTAVLIQQQKGKWMLHRHRINYYRPRRLFVFLGCRGGLLSPQSGLATLTWIHVSRFLYWLFVSSLVRDTRDWTHLSSLTFLRCSKN